MKPAEQKQIDSERVLFQLKYLIPEFFEAVIEPLKGKLGRMKELSPISSGWECDGF